MDCTCAVYLIRLYIADFPFAAPRIPCHFHEGGWEAEVVTTKLVHGRGQKWGFRSFLGIPVCHSREEM